MWQAPSDLAPHCCDRLRQLLSAEEIKRTADFRFEPHRRQYVIARGLLRMFLASYLHEDPRALHFQYTAKGKPELLFAGQQPGVHFNVAHSGGMILLGFTLGRNIGVDIEEIREDVEIDDISERFFTRSERRWLESLPLSQRHHEFFRCWTRKEAVLKGTAEGLSVALDSIDVLSNPHDDWCSLQTGNNRKWLVQDLALGNNYAAAVAVEYSSVEG